MMTGLSESGVIDIVDVCQCNREDGFLCVLRGGAKLMVTDCDGGAVRTTGPGFVTWVDAAVLERFQTLVIERSTLSCSRLPELVDGRAPSTLIVDGVRCTMSATTATSTSTTAEIQPTKVIF